MTSNVARIAFIVAGALALAACVPDSPVPTPSVAPTASSGTVALDERTPQEQLADAVLTSDLDLAATALEAGADPNLLDEATSNNPLSLAITRNDVAMVELLIAGGAEVEFEEFGFAMLGLAAQFAGGSVAQAILNTGADPNGVSFTDAEGNELSYGGPLFTAATQGNIEVMDVLLQSGARTDVVLTSGRYTLQPLGAAAFGGHLDAVDLLLMWGADPTWSGPDGLTAADMASARNHAEIYRYLREFEG
ncbi:MAG: hypothetical protein CVT64_03655 [Actinobacteria bacterium HGW-Actinobacteria-4]|nr:MAG: hypothetical protein CVT64_03655 [Actinobacteria bacterium HGW-Actinobacteria-4]